MIDKAMLKNADGSPMKYSDFRIVLKPRQPSMSSTAPVASRRS